MMQPILMKFKKEVKHSVVYETTEDDTPCRSVYVMKEWLRHETGTSMIPQQITILVEVRK